MALPKKITISRRGRMFWVVCYTCGLIGQRDSSRSAHGIARQHLRAHRQGLL